MTLRRPLLALAGLAAALAAAEVALRLAHEPAANVERPSAIPGLGYELVPHLRAEAHGWRWSINAEGWRDRDYAETRTPGVPRILGIGNSVAMGRPDPDRSALSVLEDLLAPAEVLNAGVAGYTSTQIRIALEAKGLRYRPDLVLYLLCPNDILPTGAVDAEGRIRGGAGAPTLRERLGDAARSSLLARRAAHAVNVAFARAGRPPPFGDFVPYSRRVRALYDGGPDRDRLAEDIRTMRDLCDSAGARFAVVVFPMAHQVHAGGIDTAPQAFLADLLETEEIPHLDLTSVLAFDRFEPGDPVHPDDEGHRLAAEAIAAWIRAEGLWPE